MKLFATRELCWEVRNLLAAERATNRVLNRPLRTAGEKVTYLTRADQYVRVALLAKNDARFKVVHSQVLQNVAVRVDEGTKRWLEARKKGQTDVAPPGEIGKKEYKGFTYPQYGTAATLSHGKLHLSKIGAIPVRDYRKMEGKPKTVTVNWEEGRWWVVVTCELPPAKVYRTATEVASLEDTGGDPGLTSLLTTAHGQVFDPPRALKEGLAKLRHEQRDMSRKFEMRKKLYAVEQARRALADEAPLPALRDIPYSNRLQAQIMKVAKLHTAIKNVREHHHRKLARTVERTYRLVAVEEHGVKFMFANRRLARSAADRGIWAMKQWLKSALGDRYLPTANARPGIGGNSQTCICGAAVPKTLGDRMHDCPVCGLRAPRDVVSANVAMLISVRTTVVTRGETEGSAPSCVVPGLAEGVSAPATAEVSAKREARVSEGRTITGGGEPAPGVKTAKHRKRGTFRPPPLPAATPFVSGAESPRPALGSPLR